MENNTLLQPQIAQHLHKLNSGLLYVHPNINPNLQPVADISDF